MDDLTSVAEYHVPRPPGPGAARPWCGRRPVGGDEAVVHAYRPTGRRGCLRAVSGLPPGRLRAVSGPSPGRTRSPNANRQRGTALAGTIGRGSLPGGLRARGQAGVPTGQPRHVSLRFVRARNPAPGPTRSTIGAAGKGSHHRVPQPCQMQESQRVNKVDWRASYCLLSQPRKPQVTGKTPQPLP